ncbi:LysM peptidoglycan-binding domain-containing C40 family peptidase [Arthrobacter sunyaminii]|uniref:LysM peptidoglycan-binding domain-containing C40 family peptidase n=1 Tax=Arthrobacter sunyaminii TaxID=2816859 RepID=A0A975S8G0_9MICC|nr:MULTISPECIES: LysM peptidoglycan-binding domain-containing protein [unclassified Arthrobacter]MBO0907026.1 LysM peptidoglycan-binding domain-containing protein [Arthrobacter sunyaminii]QWQ37769.1 LysM peptidoglycan-binding domain-containing C40 family peptidase [Arthrobacter sunyaminii]
MLNNTRGRHRAGNIGLLAAIANTASSKARTVGSAAAVMAAGSGLVLSMAGPASAGVIANDSTESYSAPAAVAAPVETPAPAAVSTASTHVVQSGDTLSAISATYGVSLDNVLALNGLSLESIIYPGDVITYAGGAVAEVAEAAYAAPAEAAYAAPAEAAYTAPAEASPAAADFSTFSTPASSVTPAASTGAAVTGTNSIMLNSAYAQMGAAQDCTVLVEVALRAAGHSVGDLAPAQLAAYGTPVSDPQPGDIIYYADGGMGLAHIAIYVGDGQAIHSGWNGNQTVQQSANVGSGAVYYRVA